MRIRERRVYVGPNVYVRSPAVRLTLDLGALEAWPSDRLPGLVERLTAAVPTLAGHRCSPGEPGGFVQRLRDGTWMGHVLEHVAIALQNLVGHDIAFGRTRGTGEHGCYHVVYAAEDPGVGLLAGDAAYDLLVGLLPEALRREVGLEAPGADPAARVADFVREAERVGLGPSTASLVAAARARDIPCIRLDEGALVQLGYGHRQQRVDATITGRTASIAVDLAGDKRRANRLLHEAGVPVPIQVPVHSASDAVAAARVIGYPVVVKPLDANHGRGVTAGLTDEESVYRAFENARNVRTEVLVEACLPGADHRLLVVGDRLVAAARREPAQVVGDGRSTIRALVAQANADPRRGEGHARPMTRLRLDDAAAQALTAQGLGPDSVPAAGRSVHLATTGNVSTGGSAIDVTDEVHPDFRRLAVRAARTLGLDVAGVDVITPDISRSLAEVGGGVCEVNAAPGFRMHLYPARGKPRDVAGAVLDHLFPDGCGRIPIAAITGTNGKTTTAYLLAHIQRVAGRRVGLACSTGVYLDGHRVVGGDMTGPQSARMVLRDPAVESAVLEVARGGLLRAGLGFDACSVGAVLNIGNDHLGDRGVETLDDLAYVKRVVAEVARDAVVLNADDPRCVAMAEHSRARHLCYVSLEPDNELLQDHIRRGCMAVVLERLDDDGEALVLYEHGLSRCVLPVDEVPVAFCGLARHNVQNAMFAVALARALDIDLPHIREALRSFEPSYEQLPGRLNRYLGHPFDVILDYAHNPEGHEAMGRLVARLPVAGRRIVVACSPGDRRDVDIVEAVRRLVPWFDVFVCRGEEDLRGRAPDEVPRLYERTLLEAGVPREAVIRTGTSAEGIDAALRLARPGDLVVVFADDVERAWRHIVEFQPAHAAATLPEPPPGSDAGLGAGSEAR